MKLSVITITYNDKNGLQHTLDSVAMQYYCGEYVEHIIIDGGSLDGSVNIIQNYVRRVHDDKLKISVHWISEPDKGIYNAMNKGILMAKGEYCLFLNGGDWLYDSYVLQKVMEIHMSADIICGNAIFEASKYAPREIVTPPDSLKASDLLLHYLPHQAAFIRRDLFTQIHLYDESYKIISDWLFFAEAIINNDCSYQHIPIIVSHCESEGISNNPKFRAQVMEEHQRGESSLFPLLYTDYQELRASRAILNSNEYAMQTRFFASTMGRFVRRIMKWKYKH